MFDSNEIVYMLYTLALILVIVLALIVRKTLNSSKKTCFTCKHVTLLNAPGESICELGISKYLTDFGKRCTKYKKYKKEKR